MLPKTVLVIDDFSLFIRQLNVAENIGIINALSLALERNDLAALIASDVGDIDLLRDNCPNFERIFQIVDIARPDFKTEVKIVSSLQPVFEQHHSVRFTKSAIEFAVKSMDNQETQRSMPGATIDFLDEIGASQISLPSRKRKKRITDKDVVNYLAYKENTDSSYSLREQTSQFIRDQNELRVFIAHANEDKATAQKLYSNLQQISNPWLDENDLIPGQNWKSEIKNAVKNADVVLVILSRKSTGRQGFLHKEIGYALDQAEEKIHGTISIVPTLTEECDVPERLSELHFCKLYEPNGFRNLIRALNACKRSK